MPTEGEINGQQATWFTQEEITQREQRLRNEYAAREAAREAGFRDPQVALALLDWNTVTVNAAGAATNLKEVMTNLQATVRAAIPGTSQPPPISNPPSTGAGQAGAAKPTFTREQLRDHDFYLKNQKEILEAYADGRITE